MDKKKTVYSGNPKDMDSYKEYPAEPSTWDSVKETFLPTAERVNLEAVRKRRQQAG